MEPILPMKPGDPAAAEPIKYRHENFAMQRQGRGLAVMLGACP